VSSHGEPLISAANNLDGENNDEAWSSAESTTIFFQGFEEPKEDEEASTSNRVVEKIPTTMENFEDYEELCGNGSSIFVKLMTGGGKSDTFLQTVNQGTLNVVIAPLTTLGLNLVIFIYFLFMTLFKNTAVQT
jgi:hypothetical protein